MVLRNRKTALAASYCVPVKLRRDLVSACNKILWGVILLAPSFAVCVGRLLPVCRLVLHKWQLLSLQNVGESRFRLRKFDRGSPCGNKYACFLMLGCSVEVYSLDLLLGLLFFFSFFSSSLGTTCYPLAFLSCCLCEGFFFFFFFHHTVE